jgi:hypothetical protein
MKNPDALQPRAKALHLHGLLAHWSEAAAAGWPEALIGWEEDERPRRSLERRLQSAHIGRFKPLCDFDWNWPMAIDRGTFEALMSLDFLKDATNAVRNCSPGVVAPSVALDRRQLGNLPASPRNCLTRSRASRFYTSGAPTSRPCAT